MTNDDLCYLSAAQALGLFKRRKLSPVELTKALISRAGRVNPKINCLADRYFDEAIAQATASEARYMRRGARTGALDGVPLAVKDAQRLKGKRTTQGSLIFRDWVDDRSDPMIERLQKAGAVILARTTTPEFCLSGITASRIWGVTRNPWNTEWGPGGSSGGSAAALAAGITTLATGTDIGGSIRIPAAACGVVGFKPPHGRNPDGPPANFDRFNHCGPMTRSVADAALMQNVTSGPHPLDHDSLRRKVRLPGEAKSIRGLNIAYSVNLGYVPVEPAVARNMLRAVEVFRSLGARVEEVELGWTAEVEKNGLHWYNLMHFGRQAIWHLAESRHLMTDYAITFAEMARKLTAADDAHRPWEQAHRMYQTLGPVLAAHDLFICPTNNAPSVKAEHDPWDGSFTVNGQKADPEYGWVMTHQFNMLHNCPVLSLPSGHAETGVPTGIQLVGRTWDDVTVFRAGLAYEKAVGGWYGTNKTRPRL
ncbi:amidase [Aestuariivirga sp.]|uniref:amidase n=1 Tax=Aestuariivirga sp. TaxID=2650926 RepID=UPI0025C6BDC7|nr:amidase [Aestuariivirga sp.]MCA3555873.1 amidase [Aestuariivirga sp.]